MSWLTAAIKLRAAMGDLRVRPMTSSEFGPFRDRLVREYAADHVRAGNWTARGGRGVSPPSRPTPWCPRASTRPVSSCSSPRRQDGEAIGHVWIGLERRPGVPEAWIYSIEIAADHRGQGYGRALLSVAEHETAKRGRQGARPQRLRAERGRAQPLRVSGLRSRHLADAKAAGPGAIGFPMTRRSQSATPKAHGRARKTTRS